MITNNKIASYILSTLLMISISTNLFSQTKLDNSQIYSTNSDEKPSSYESFHMGRNKFTNSTAFELLKAPLIIATAGLVFIPYKKRFYNIRHTYVPTFENHYDDYLQYTPAIVMLGLKKAGVKGRSSWGRMLVSDAISIAIMAGMVNSLKYSTRVNRPDSKQTNSFPSGHTATAFMTATMFHKEYGNLSKWCSIGAYTTATLTGVTRMLNNKHWISDVCVGAAIGIISTNLGYLVTDKIFKDNRKLRDKYFIYFGKEYKPSFNSFYVGVSDYTDIYKTTSGRDARLYNSARVGFEGAWFINKNFGIGGNLSMATSNISTTNDIVGTSGISVGEYFSFNLSDRVRLGSKALVGMDFTKANEINYLNISSNNLNITTGLSISYLTSRTLGFKLFADYRHHFSHINNMGANEVCYGISAELMLGKPAY